MFVATIAMVLMAAGPAVAQPIEFVGDAVFVTVEGVSGVEQIPVTGVYGDPNFGGGAIAGGSALSLADPVFGAFSTASFTTNAAFLPEGLFVQAGTQCIDTTDFGLCP